MFFAKFRRHRAKNEKLMTENLSQLNALVLITEPSAPSQTSQPNPSQASITPSQHQPRPSLRRRSRGHSKCPDSNLFVSVSQ